MAVKYAVINRYGIKLAAGRKSGHYLYIPEAIGEAGHRACETWIRRHDPANTCAIVEIDPDNI